MPWYEATTSLSFALATYIFACLVLLYSRPECMFTDDGYPRHIGTEDDQTILPFWLVTFAIGIIAYFWAEQYGKKKTTISPPV
jgi:hypothetical protein